MKERIVVKILFIHFLLLILCSDLPAQTRVRFLPHWLHQAQFSGIYMAIEKGIYKDYGLEVEVIDGGPLAPISEALDKDQTDFCSMFLSGAIEVHAHENKIFNICQLSQKSALMYVAKKSSGIDDIADFNGKKIGIWRSDFRELPMAFIKEFDIEAEIVPITSTIDLFLYGGIDIMCVMWYNEYDQMYNAGIDYDDLNSFFFFDYDLNFPEDGIYCKQEFYENNPEVCKNFAEATLEGWQYAFTHPEETIDVVMLYMFRHNIPASRAHQQWMLKTMEKLFRDEYGIISGELRKEDFIKTSKTLLESGSIDEMFEFEEFLRR